MTGELTMRPARSPETCTLPSGRKVHILGGTDRVPITFCGREAWDSEEYGGRVREADKCKCCWLMWSRVPPELR